MRGVRGVKGVRGVLQGNEGNLQCYKGYRMVLIALQEICEM